MLAGHAGWEEMQLLQHRPHLLRCQLVPQSGRQLSKQLRQAGGETCEAERGQASRLADRSAVFDWQTAQEYMRQLASRAFNTSSHPQLSHSLISCSAHPPSGGSQASAK